MAQLVKWLSVSIVALAFVFLNLWGDSANSSNSSPHLDLNDIVGFIHGWPTEFLVRAYNEYDTRPLDWESRTSRLPFGSIPPIRYFGLFQLAINMAVGIVILSCTFVVAERYQQGRSGPFQFSIRGLLAGTTLVAGFLCLIRLEIARWEHLVWLPVGAGLICAAIVFVTSEESGETKTNRKWPTFCHVGFGVILVASLLCNDCLLTSWSLMHKGLWVLFLAPLVGSLFVLAIAGSVAGGVLVYRRRNANNGKQCKSDANA